MPRNRLAFLVFSVMLLSFSVNGCAGTGDQNIQDSSQEPNLELQDNIVSALGEVVPEEWANLTFPSGGVALEVLVTPGQVVLKNTILARVDDIAQQVSLANAESALASALANQERVEELDGSDIEIEAALKAVEAAEAVVDQAQQSLDDTTLKAPFDGVIVDVFVQNFEAVSPGQPVVLLADLNNLVIETTDLGEVDVVKVQFGDPVEIVFDALPDVTTTGKVVQIALRPESGSGVYYTVKIQMDQIPENLRWGMSAFVEIEVSR